METKKDLNAKHIKEEGEHNSDGTVDDLKGAFANDGPNVNGGPKKEVVVAVTENDKEEVTVNETFVMKTLRIFKNKKYLRSETFRIQGNDLMSFGDKEVLSEDQVNDDLDNTGSDNDVYMNVHAETLYASDRELLEDIARDSKEEVCNDDEITAKEIDDQLNKLDGDIPDNKDGIITVEVETYSEATSEVEIKGVGLMPQAENSNETLKKRDKFPDAEEVTQFEVYESSQENHLENLDIIKNTLEETGEDNKDTKYEMEDMNGDQDETFEVTGEDEHDKSTDKKSSEALGEKHNNADSLMLEENDMEVNAEVVQVYKEVVKVLFKGTFLENSKEILENLDMFPEVENNQDDSHDARVLCLEQHVEKDYVEATIEEYFDDEKDIFVKVSEHQAEKSTIMKVLYEGTYLENLKEINENLNKCNEIDDENIDVNVLNANFFSPENLKNFALETLATAVDVKDYNKEKIQPSSVVDDVTEPGDDESNVAGSEAADAPEIKDTERIEFKVMLLVILTVCFILVSIVRIAVSNLITLLLLVLQYIHLSLMVAMLDMFLEHDTKFMGNTEKELMFPDLLGRALDKFEDFKVDMLDGMPVVQDKLVSLLRAINTDLGQAELDDEEEDQLLFSASANTTDTMSST